MRTYLECYPCFMKQAIKCTEFLSAEPVKRKEILDATMDILISLGYDNTPPGIARAVYRKINSITGIGDPFRETRKHDNRQMLEVYSDIKHEIRNSEDALYKACKLAAGGNMIDSGAGTRKEDHTHEDIRSILETVPAIDDFNELENDLEKTRRLLYLGDNSGEIVMDRLFIETIKDRYPGIEVYFAVRGGPVINDVLREDAVDVGLDRIATIISNGDTAPGTDLKYCSDEFRELFGSADTVISKGQGNYETLNDVKRKNLYFLFMIKCPVVAGHTGTDVGKMLISKSKI
ncbi:MAG: DUF89 family protein [Elusimicrobia bacterium]|nr:DUF89 family protein [Elusimicrobiota bacterium]